MSSLSRATRSSRGKGKPQLASFVQGSPVAACYRPPVPATGPRLTCVHTSASEEMTSFGGVFSLAFLSDPRAFHHHKATILNSPTPRPAVSCRLSPLPPHAEYVKLRVIAEQRHILMNCLCRQHPVEGVFVVAGQKSCSLGMFRGDGKQQISCRRHLEDKVLRQIPSEIELSQTIFGRNFPRRNG